MVTNAHEAKERRPILASGVVLHVLPDGAEFDLTTRVLVRSEPAAATPTRPTSWRRPTVICARWPATSPPETSPRPCCAAASPAVARSRSVTDPLDAQAPATTRPTSQHPGGGRPSPDLRIVRDPRLPRRQRLVLRQGDPPRRRPRGARGVTRPTPCRASPSTSSRRCPGLREHSCSRGRAAASSSGCTRAPGSATSPSTSRWPCSRSSGHDIRRGKTRAVKGQPGRYNVIYGYVDEQVGLAAGRLAVRLVNHLVAGRPRARLRPRSSTRSSCARSARRSAPRPRRSSTRRSRATSPGSGSTSTRWCSSARASTPSASARR